MAENNPGPGPESTGLQGEQAGQPEEQRPERAWENTTLLAFEALRLDYEQTNQYIRMLTDIRFKLLAFVPALTAVAAGLLTRSDGDPEVALAVGVLGFFVTLGIVFYEMRNTTLYDAAIGRAANLESIMGFRSFTQCRQGGLFNGRPRRPELFQGSSLYKRVVNSVEKLRGREPSQHPAFIVWHDRGLALVYGSALGGWVYILLYSLLTWLDSDSSSALTGSASILGAGVVAVLFIVGFHRWQR